MPEGIFFVVFFAVLIWVLFVFFTKKGKGIMFGGKIIKTYCTWYSTLPYNKLNHRKTTRRPKSGLSACVFRCLKRYV